MMMNHESTGIRNSPYAYVAIFGKQQRLMLHVQAYPPNFDAAQRAPVICLVKKFACKKWGDLPGFRFLSVGT